MDWKQLKMVIFINEIYTFSAVQIEIWKLKIENWKLKTENRIIEKSNNWKIENLMFWISNFEIFILNYYIFKFEILNSNVDVTILKFEF